MRILITVIKIIDVMAIFPSQTDKIETSVPRFESKGRRRARSLTMILQASLKRVI